MPKTIKSPSYRSKRKGPGVKFTDEQRLVKTVKCCICGEEVEESPVIAGTCYNCYRNTIANHVPRILPA